MISDDFTELIKKNIQKNSPFEVSDYGKTIRSKLGISALRACNVEISRGTVDFLTAIELIHTASLFHDDVIDNEPPRRADTDNKTSVIYGDILLTNAIGLITGLNHIALINLLNNTIKDMCRGELIQKSQTGRIPSVDDYILKTGLKTASLFKSMFEGLFVLTGNDLLKPFIEFGENFGIAFQIKNDLDNFLTTKTDLGNGIYTAPFLWGEDCNPGEISIEKTVGLMDNYINKAINCLNSLKESSYKDLIIGETRCLRNLEKNIINGENFIRI